MPTAQGKKATAEQVTKYSDMFSAMGTEARLQIMQLLLSAHPEGLVVGENQEELAYSWLPSCLKAAIKVLIERDFRSFQIAAKVSFAQLLVKYACASRIEPWMLRLW
jgi:hypothetical protein